MSFPEYEARASTPPPRLEPGHPTTRAGRAPDGRNHDDHDSGPEARLDHGPPGLEGGLVHQLPDGLREQRRPGAGLVPEEFKKIGVEYAYFRHAPENNWYPHYIHNLDNLVRFGGLYPPIHVNADIRRTVLLGSHLGQRGRLHGGARPGPALPDGGPQGQEDRHQQEPEHHQERLVAHPGAHGHREHAHAQRHDDGRHRARRVPVPGRLVRQARDARAADEQPLRAVDAPRPQARPRVPPAGDGAAERHRRRHLHPEQGLPAPAGGHRADQDDRGPDALPRLDASRSPTPPPSSPAPT